MICETIYGEGDLMHGICECCGEESDEIDVNTGICIDCLEEQKFYEMSMKNYKENTKWKNM